MAKKNSGRSPTKYVTYFTTKKTRRCSYTVALQSEQQQVPMKIEGVRMRKSRWIAEIKHPKKKNVRIWLGSYATPEEASKVYQLKKTEHEKLKLRATTNKDKKLVGDQESSPDDQETQVVLFDDLRAVDFNDQETVEESKVEYLSDDRDVAVNVTEFDDQEMEVDDYEAERSLSKGKVVDKEFGNMLLQLGPVLIDRYGYILGEFSWMDDLSIG